MQMAEFHVSGHWARFANRAVGLKSKPVTIDMVEWTHLADIVGEKLEQLITTKQMFFENAAATVQVGVHPTRPNELPCPSSRVLQSMPYPDGASHAEIFARALRHFIC